MPGQFRPISWPTGYVILATDPKWKNFAEKLSGYSHNRLT
jgi:hypothetical protein